MISRRFFFFILILAAASFACEFNTASDSPEPVSDQVTESAPAVFTPIPTLTPELADPAQPAIKGLSLDQLRSAQYQLGARDDAQVIQFTDGKYQHGADATTFDFAYVALTQFGAIGDLTGDGVDEAAAIVLENYGGTGNFGFITIYTNVNGLPVFLTSVMIDDRPMINSLSIENGEVYLDAVVHGFNDGGCCPQLATTRRLALVNNQLRIVHYTTLTPTGAQRAIEITSPLNGEDAFGNAQISGSISIAPFENTLSYFVYDAAGNQYSAGPVQVNAPDFGAPGTFNENISLNGIPAGTTVYIEIQDISAADGSLLAMDVVKLMAK